MKEHLDFVEYRFADAYNRTNRASPEEIMCYKDLLRELHKFEDNDRLICENCIEGIVKHYME